MPTNLKALVPKAFFTAGGPWPTGGSSSRHAGYAERWWNTDVLEGDMVVVTVLVEPVSAAQISVYRELTGKSSHFGVFG